MKSLIQYLFEALVNGPELEKNLKFEETDIEEILDILDTDKYNHFADLCGKRYTKDVVRENVFLLNNSTHFKIMYEGTLLGIFSVCLPKDFNDLLKRIKQDSKKAKDDYRDLIKLFLPFVSGYDTLDSYDLLDKNDCKDIIEDFLEESKRNLENLKDYDAYIEKYEKQMYEYSEKANKLYDEFVKTHDDDIKAQMDSMNNKYNEVIDNIEKTKGWKKNTEREVEQQRINAAKNLLNRIMSITGFVVIWQLSKDAKKNIDVNQVSLLKVFFQKLIELIKSTGAKYIMAQGKDAHVTHAYIQLGGFKSTEEFYKKHSTPYFYQINADFLEGTVIKRI